MHLIIKLLHCIILYGTTLLYCTIISYHYCINYYTALYHMMLYYIILCYAILYHYIILYYIILYYIILYEYCSRPAEVVGRPPSSLRAEPFRLVSSLGSERPSRAIYMCIYIYIYICLLLL